MASKSEFEICSPRKASVSIRRIKTKPKTRWPTVYMYTEKYQPKVDKEKIEENKRLTYYVIYKYVHMFK